MAQEPRLSPKRQALLDKILKKKGLKTVETNIPRQTGDRTIAPVSFAQQRLWFLDQLEPNNSAYNITATMRLSGLLNVAVLEQSLNEIVRRHDGLRTTFAVIEGKTMQVVSPTLHLTLLVVDLGELAGSEREARIQQLAVDELRHPFDLARGPLVRATLLRLGSAEHIFLFTMHHIISDGWSNGVFIRQATALYEAYLAGRPSPLPELPIQYTDFSVWQRGWLQGKALETQLAYWKQQFPCAPPILELPADKPRPLVLTFQGAHLTHRLPRSLQDDIQALSRKEGVTPFMTLLSAFQILLYRYTGQTDFVVGSPIANRNHPETEDLIGFFVNTLALRADLSGNPTFRELLQRTRETTLGAYKHQDMPFEMLIETLNVQRNLSHAPLFQVMFTLQNTPAQAIKLSNLTLEWLKFESGATQFDLTLSMVETEQGLAVEIEYSTDLFEKETIQRLGQHFEVLLTEMVADPEQHISALPLLTDAELHQLLVEWNATQVEYPQEQCIHELFEAQVEKNPEAVALVFEDQELTYRELNARANQLAHYLRSQGVGPDVAVGICVERSLEMIVGLLGILKAGGAYLPLNPAHPQERLAYMLQDARPAVLLTQQHLQQTFPVPGFCLDSQWDTLNSYARTNPQNIALPGNLAYIIYTSGSTGKPKGVLLTHAGLSNLAHAQVDAFSIQTPQRILQFASFNFDGSMCEISIALSSGATLCLATRDDLMPGEKLDNIVQKLAINVVILPPVALNVLSATSAKLETIVVAGEACPANLVAQWAGDHHFFNAYGPTEATVCTSIQRCHVEHVGSPPIGRPIANVQVYLLDAVLNPVPVGVPGELYIAGVSLARGYLNRPDLTAEKFIPNPFSPPSGGAAGGRMYKSGDLARYLPDGSIEYLDRIDSQVKIRGFRIELGEIEAALAALPEVREVVVLAREDVPGDKRLVAYLVPKAGCNLPETAALRSKLAQSLPEYMIPAHFLSLGQLSLTLNDKIDRKALPAPDMTRSEVGYVAPRTLVEEQLAHIWADVLKLDRVGIHDNFFELGGHSLLATQVISRLRAAFQTELAFRTLFESSTVEALAQKIELARQDQGRLVAPPIVPVPRKGELPLSFAQQRLLFLDQLEPGSALYNLPVAVHLVGELNEAALRHTLNEIVRRHEMLRTRFAMLDDAPVQVIAEQLELTLPITDLTELPAAEREAKAQQLAQDEARTPFDLSTGPLIRASLIRLDATDHILLFTMHHIASDGWSMGVLINEVAALYTAYIQNQPSPLPELTIQYADFAHWQRQWLQQGALEKQLAYWKLQLNTPGILELPTDWPRLAGKTSRGATQAFYLPESVSRSLRLLEQQDGVTLFMILLAAFKVMLYRYTGQEDVIVGSLIANRTRAEIENLIGFFLNTLVLRTNLAGNPSFRELLRRVKTITLDAYANQDIPIDVVVDAIDQKEGLGRNPLFETLFVLQNAPMRQLEPPYLLLTPMEMDRETADLALSVYWAKTDQGLKCVFEYKTDLFKRETIARMMTHYQTLLGSVAENPDRKISEQTLLPEWEQFQLMTEWNNTQAEYPRKCCIHELVEAQVEQTPDAVAVMYEGQELTYRELNERANQLAHHLQSLGVEPGVFVGVCLERSVDLIVAILSVMKSGGAYVPMDPNLPPERLALIMEDTDMSVLLTNSDILSTLPDYTGQHVCLDLVGQRLHLYPIENPVSWVSAQDPIYVIYTSGSTGKPKGVILTHHSLVNAYRGWDAAYHLRSEVRAHLQMANFPFDVFSGDLVRALCSGGKLVLCPAEFLLMPAQLYTLLRTAHIDAAEFVPAVFRSLVDYLEQTCQTLDFLRILVIASDKWYVGEYKKFLRFCGPNTRLINSYGLTEAAVDSTYFVSSPADGQNGLNLAEDRLVPIGRPFPNTQVYILDAQQQLAPIGIPGKLYIAGAGLARGYLNRPDLTAEKFIPNPFSPPSGGTGGARMYKSGDLARYLPDGNIEYLGRIDNQVKVRGFRIELGEIEAALAALPEVREVVVLAREDTPGDKHLAAYLVAQTGQSLPETATLRNKLLQSLPNYMIPAYFIVLESLPLTPNGKVDRKALPAPSGERPGLEHAYLAPRTPVEKALVDIWAQVLKLEQVGVNDNFFELGGDSILSIQIISRANRTGYALTSKQIFQYQTIAELAAVADISAGIQAEQGLVTGPGSLIPIQYWFFEQNLVAPHHYNQALFLGVAENIDFSLLKDTLWHLLQHHDALRLRFSRAETGGWLPVYADPDESANHCLRVDLSVLPEAEQNKVMEETASAMQSGLDLSVGPLMQVVLFDLGAQRTNRLLWICHHLLVDGVSWRILVEDFQTTYAQLRLGKKVVLPLKTTSYQQWAQRLTEFTRSATLQQELNYWLAETRLQVSPLPIDFQESPEKNTGALAQSVTVSLSMEETQALLQEIHQAYGVQINDVFLTALGYALTHWTGTETCLIDLEGHGREEIVVGVNLSRTVGWFTTIFPVLLELKKASDLRQALKSVKKQLQNIPNRGIGYGLLRYLSDDADIVHRLQQLPRSEISFNYLGQLDLAQSNDSLFSVASESSGAASSLYNKRLHLIDINGFVANGQMQMEWTYCSAIHRQDTIERLAHSFMETLRWLITHKDSPETESDRSPEFFDVDLSQGELDDILKEIDFSSEES
jgi:amino acid adenylation domain-containing protein/non-ribosomal peptide synthase protein (TIGR01720 family)